MKYTPIDENKATIIPCRESRNFLGQIGIQGEIISTVGHSQDGIAVIFDDRNCCVEDLEPIEFIGAYKKNRMLKEDWEQIVSYHPTTIHSSHAPDQNLNGIPFPRKLYKHRKK